MITDLELPEEYFLLLVAIESSSWNSHDRQVKLQDWSYKIFWLFLSKILCYILPVNVSERRTTFPGSKFVLRIALRYFLLFANWGAGLLISIGEA